MEKDEDISEEEYDVELVKGDNGETKVKVVRGQVVEQFHHEKTYSESMKRLILYSKISASISLISLIVALTLLGLGLTADVVSEPAQKTRNILSIGLFIIGLGTFSLALYLDKKTAKSKNKGKDIAKRRIKNKRKKNKNP